MDVKLRNSKIEKIQNGGAIRILDLFSGCGGLSLGFQAANCKPLTKQLEFQNEIEIVAGIEYDADAARTHALNFHRELSVANPMFGKYAQKRDITKTEPHSFFSELDKQDAHNQVDIIVGGPPCQAFTRIGRAKLREIAKNPTAHLQDDRINLYTHYLHWVEQLQPVALLMENVPEMMNHGGVNYATLICSALENMGYVCAYTLLNTVHYGVPQMRSRMFLMAWSKELGQPVSFPSPTHEHELPDGYKLSQNAALKLIHREGCQWFHPIPVTTDKLKAAVSTADALVGLPEIEWHLRWLEKHPHTRSRSRPKTAWKKETEFDYVTENPQNFYDKLMRRGLTGKKNIGRTDSHVMRWLPRDYPVFREMEPGMQYPEAVEVALEMFKNALPDAGDPEAYSEKWLALKKYYVPPYDPSKFPNKWRKLEADQPARTLMAHLSKDSYSHIHYDSKQARTITVREAARLQSFPDTFKFSGSMNSAFRQIGNAVPPLMAWQLASHMLMASGLHKKASDISVQALTTKKTTDKVA